MRKLYVLFFLLTASISYGQDLTITGIIDGPLSGGLPKAMELYVINDIADLSIYGLEKAANGAAADGVDYNFPAGAVTAGTFLYLSKETEGFTTYFGIAPTYVDAVIDMNGDDTMILYNGSNIVDIYGVAGVDGTDEVWEHLDGWAYRNNTFGPNSSFTASEWTFSGKNAVDNCETNAGCSSVFPIGTYQNVLSVDTFALTDISLYPNPSALDYVHITSKSGVELSVAVYDILGKRYANQSLKNSKLDVSALRAGVYILKISDDVASTTKKLIIR